MRVAKEIQQLFYPNKNHALRAPPRLTAPPDPVVDASAHRDRSLDNDAENRVGALSATGVVKADFVLDPGRFRTKLPVKAIGQPPQSGWD